MKIIPARQLLPRYSVDDYQRWKGDWELWDGHPVAMSPRPFGHHQAIVAALHLQLGHSLAAESCRGRALLELDWIVNENTVVRPDLIILCGEVPERYLESPPSLVAEVLSVSTRANDLHYKRDLYLSQQVPVYLIVDPDAKQITCHRFEDGSYLATNHEDSLSLLVCDHCQLTVSVPSLFR